MDLENVHNGLADWNFPSPMATPTHSSFHASMNESTICQTPKTLAPLPSHFSDAFATPQLPAYATPLPSEYTPSHTTPLQSLQPTPGMLPSHRFSSSSHPPRAQPNPSPMHPQAEHQHSVTNPQSHYPYQGPGLYQDQAISGMQPFHMTSPGFAPHMGNMIPQQPQVHTPPPTRGNSVKRPQMHRDRFTFNTPSAATHEFATPHQPFGPAHHSVPSFHGADPHVSPMSIAHMQFSPNILQCAPAGPASAPVQQTFSFWDPNNSFMLQQSPHVLDDPFAPTGRPERMPWAPHILPSNDSHSEAFTSDVVMNNPPVAAISLPPQPCVSARPSLTCTSSSHTVTTGPVSASVDPSLVYTSPARTLPPQLKARPSKGRAPSLQTSEARRRDSGSSVVDRADTGPPVQPMASAPRPLRRSYTAIPLRSQSELLSPDDSTRTLQVPRTASPLKRLGRSHAGPIPQTRKLRSRASVILTVDENGRARTETRRANSQDHVRGDETPTTRAVRQRYPVLFDSDSSDADSLDDEPCGSSTVSRSASFSIGSSRGEERKARVTRQDSALPVAENLEALSILHSSRSSSSVRGSLSLAPSKAAVAAVAQLRQTAGLRKGSVSSTLAAPRLTLRRAASSATCTVETTSDIDMDLDKDSLPSDAGYVDMRLDTLPWEALEPVTKQSVIF